MLVPADLDEVSKTVWELALDLPLVRLHADETSARGAPDWMTVSIGVRGAWDGWVRLRCRDELARRAAAIMLSAPEEETTDTDALDAMLELVNILGGNMKALLPAPSLLGLPVAGERQASGRPGRCQARLYRCGTMPVAVVVEEQSAAPLLSHSSDDPFHVA